MILPSPLNPTAGDPQDKTKLTDQRHVLAETAQWLERLTANEDFRRFIEFVRRGADATGALASDIEAKDADTRDAYAQRYFALRGMADWPEKQLAAARTAMKATDEKLRAL